MCGILGIVARGPDDALARQMLSVEAHRGPDGEGQWSTQVHGRHVTLGHRRLSILDLSETGAQPMLDASGDYAITFNGEIYNYIEVRGELTALGAQFRSSSDTEVIVEAYKRWGAACVDRLNGMFAFAILDKPRGTLFCARDRYGEKPFLYSARPDLFAFASEYKALLLHPEIPLDFDEWRLVRAAHDQSTGLDAERQTVFDAIEQLLPGEAMEVELATLNRRVWRYWQVPRDVPEAKLDERDAFAQFRELLIDSVRLRLRSDVPVGSCLSGGLDSSAIVCIVRKLLGDDAPYNTFTGRFPGTSADEWEYARQVIDATKVISHVVEPTVARFVDELPGFMWSNELPVGSSSQFAQWSVFRLAKEHGVTVLLDGQGADETLGGYEQYFAFYVAALRERGDTARLAREEPMIRERYPRALLPPAKALRDKLPLPVRRWLSSRLGIGTNLMYGLRSDVARQLVHENARGRTPGFNPLTSALEQDCFGRYLTTLLRYGDRNSMAHSREVRLPFCDYRLAELVFRLPPHMLMGEVQTKRLLRESMRGILPEGIRTRWNKQGFRPPQDQWFTAKRLQTVVRDTLTSASFRNSKFWDAKWWLAAMDRVERGEPALGWVIWAPVMIEWWKQHFLAPVRAMRASVSKGAAA